MPVHYMNLLDAFQLNLLDPDLSWTKQKVEWKNADDHVTQHRIRQLTAQTRRPRHARCFRPYARLVSPGAGS